MLSPIVIISIKCALLAFEPDDDGPINTRSYKKGELLLAQRKAMNIKTEIKEPTNLRPFELIEWKKGFYKPKQREF